VKFYNQPLVSIITIVYNAKKTLEQTILSVINQSYKNIEYIIIDGGSTDGSIDIIKQYENKITYWVSEKDNGISDAFNKGILQCKGEIVGILNADDWYEKNAVETIIKKYTDDTSVYCADLNLIDNSDFPFKKMKSKIWFLDYGMHIMHPSTFVKKSCYDNYGLFDIHLKFAMDYDLLLRLKNNGCKFSYIPNVIVNMRIEGVSSNVRKNFKEELKVKRRHVKGLKLVLAFLYNKINLYRILAKKIINGK
jgi:glycosyltransferase involved in cell wall biosynthesis